MDDMDIDSVFDVPDTPERLIAQTSKGKGSIEKGSILSASGYSGHCNRFVDDTRNGLKVNDRGSRKLLIHAPKRVSSKKSDGQSNLAITSGNSSSSSSNNSLIFRRVPGEMPNYENKHFQPTEDNKRLHTQSSAGHVVDLTEQNGHVQEGKREYPRGSRQAEGYGKIPQSTSSLPSSCNMSNSTMTIHCANKGKEPNNKVSGLNSDDVIGSLAETQPKAGKGVPTSLNSVSSPRVAGQKRLVRNGCISPHNIAKAKNVGGLDRNGGIDVGPNHAPPMVSSATRIGVGAMESITEENDSHKSKGKGIMMTHPLSIEESDAQNGHTGNSTSTNEIVKEVGVSNKDRCGSLDEVGGWRSTRNRSKKVNLPESDEHQYLSSERAAPCLVNRLPRNGETRRKLGSSAGTSNNFPAGQHSASSQSASLLPTTHRGSSLRPQLDQYNGHQAARNMLPKRQKHKSSSSSLGEYSGAALDDSDIVFLGSSRNTSRSGPTQSRNSMTILEPVIEIDEASPEVRGNGFSAGGCSGTAPDAMARQIEADEMLARELQEQFYNEVPSAGVGEDDVHVAMALQCEESLNYAFPRRSQPVFSPRSSMMPSSARQSQSRSSQNISRRSPHARGPNLSRMARLRSRFPGRPRTISSSSSTSSRERNSLFPPDMDVDMRMFILEALEAFSDMGVDNNLLEIQREFNENDYEMLLALDENNHQHGGATDHQVNGLPQSTVQNDNLEEACAICLETPTIGDIIRHLPCLHKFHKDCIDPWLRRRTSCPVCKSSIT